MTPGPDDPRLCGLDEDWWEAFEPPEELRAEIIGGELIMTPSPGVRHAFAATRLLVLLQDACPDGLVTVQSLEWRTTRQGRVAWASIPDLVVVRDDIDRLTEAPVLAVEILSNSDRRRHSSGRTRIEVKREAYAAAGLEHYLEVDFSRAGVAAVTRFELNRGRLKGVHSFTRIQVVAEAVGDEVLEAELPFRYRVQPSSLG